MPTCIGADVRAARLLASSVRFRTRALVTAVGQADGQDLGDATRQNLRALREVVAALRGHLGDGSERALLSPTTSPTATAR